MEDYLDELDTLEEFESIEQAEDVSVQLDDGIKKIGIEDVYKRKQEKFEYLKAHNWKLWPTTPFPVIDEMTKWFKKGWVVAIGAFSNTWKSQLSYFYAQHFVKEWLEVAYFSLEVASEDVLIMVSQYFYWYPYKTAASQGYDEKLKNLYIYDVWDYYNLDWIEAYVNKFQPDIVFIDFIQILEVQWLNEYDKLNNAVRRLQRLAVANGTVIVYLSQISNEDLKASSVLDVKLKWSWNLIASSDYVFIMKRWNIDGEIVFWLKKNKHWPAYKTYSLMFDFANGKCLFDWTYVEASQQSSNL